jgi:hypothetical protein
VGGIQLALHKTDGAILGHVRLYDSTWMKIIARDLTLEVVSCVYSWRFVTSVVACVVWPLPAWLLEGVERGTGYAEKSALVPAALDLDTFCMEGKCLTRRPSAPHFKIKFSQATESHDSSVGIALGYGLDCRGSRVRFPAGAGNFSLCHRVQNGFGAHPASYPMGTRGSFPGGKAGGAWSWPLTYI